MERFLNFETRQRFQVNLDTGAITVEPSKVVHVPAEEVKAPKQNISKDTDWRGFEGPPPANSFMHNLLKGVFPELPNVEFRFDIASNEDIPSKTSPLSGLTWLQELEKDIKESWNREAAEGGMSGNPFRALHERMAEAAKRWINPDPERKAFIEKVEKEAEEAEKRDAIDGWIDVMSRLLIGMEFKVDSVLDSQKQAIDWDNPSDMAKAFEETQKMERADKLAEEIRATGTDFKPKTMDFSAALWELKRGKKVRRTNHTVGDYLYIPNPKSNYPENYIHKKTGIDDICQWRPREGDVIADNWIVVD